MTKRKEESNKSSEQDFWDELFPVVLEYQKRDMTVNRYRFLWERMFEPTQF